MRQDAVMQQVFVLMNRLFQSNISTAKRKLTIRTYKVRYDLFCTINNPLGFESGSNLFICLTIIFIIFIFM